MPQNSDPDSMDHVAGQVEALHDRFKEAKSKMTGITGANPFGDLKHPDERPGETPSEHAAKTLAAYKDRMHSQFDAAADLMHSTGGALRAAAKALRETDAAAKDSVTVKDDTLS